MKKTFFSIACFVLACVGLMSCANFQFWAAPHGTVQIKTFIDGSDTVKIRSNGLWYEHHQWDLPGKWQGRFDEPTFINEMAWKPEWNGLISDRFQDFSPALPQKALDQITLTKLQGRGNVDITAKPSKENDYTLSIFFDDNQYGGAEWYEIKVEW